MKIRIIAVMAAALLLIGAPSGMAAGTDHSQFIKGPFKSGEEVTKVCLQCHEKQAEDFMKTSHYKWKGAPRSVKGMENSKDEYGKANLLNNFCTDVEGGSRAFCVKCHAGYGWVENAKLPAEKSKVDCLICHAKEGNYKKGLGGEVDKDLFARGKINLEKAAQSVSLPNRDNCGVCHFFGGGGDAVKHGDMDSSLSKPGKEHDVHMGGPTDMTCQACHTVKEHSISGASLFLATNDGRVSCEDCHRDPHKDSTAHKVLARHQKTVACQTCHIPAFAKAQATKMSWDWSTVGKDIEDIKEEFGKETYAKHKGDFTWGMNVTPTYAWYNGKMERYLKGEKIKDPRKVLYLSKPVGDIKDPDAKIYPFKVHTGKQPMDSQYKYLSIFQNFGGLWSHYNWEKALTDGARTSGLPYSGKHEFIPTAFYGSINHEIAPKEKALKCGDCHFGINKRLDWKTLGYTGDPMRVGSRFSAKDEAKGDTRASEERTRDENGKSGRKRISRS
ncbi:MAG: tetrathionate reductase family octaheme c-type cytochrome [Alphaproteobacteria bacterium]|uniref:Tetrathionate reductase family octaheme c-type cytochrome n=1 Tax=Candidatus Nitrobium versatile TaxID=2884831 RepID=A0A953JCV5_9BACT|nr:tetrathionate reductase family octaheme c-type cytochrome [Candidatus Nitrobium versatile]